MVDTRIGSTGLIGAMVIVFMAVIAPAFNVDDAAAFNYLNNVEGASALYYYNGYVHLVPELTAYLLSPLPLVVQAVSYRVVPLVFALLLYREACRLFALRGPASEAALLGLAVVLVVRVVFVQMGAVLSSTSWIAPLLGMLVVIRINAGTGRYSGAAIVAVLISTIAFPPGLLVAGLCAFHAVKADESGRRLQNAILALVAVVAHGWFARGFPDPIWNADLTAIPETFIAGLRERKFHTLTAVASLAVLAGAWQWGRAQPRRDCLAVRSLSYVGWGTALAFLVSRRFSVYGGFEPQYAAAPACCALLALGWMIQAERLDGRRAFQVGALTGVAAAAVVMSLYGSLRGPLELALMKYRFVILASEERAHCSDDRVFVFEDEESSPILFCRPRPLPPGNFRIVDFVPMVGSADPGASLDEKPSIINPKPLF